MIEALKRSVCVISFSHLRGLVRLFAVLPELVFHFTGSIPDSAGFQLSCNSVPVCLCSAEEFSSGHAEKTC